MCNCITEIEKVVFEKLKKDKENVGIVNTVSMKQIAFVYAKNGSYCNTYNDLEYEMTNVKKDKSIGATKKYTISMHHTFCPFWAIK